MTVSMHVIWLEECLQRLLGHELELVQEGTPSRAGGLGELITAEFIDVRLDGGDDGDPVGMLGQETLQKSVDDKQPGEELDVVGRHCGFLSFGPTGHSVVRSAFDDFVAWSVRQRGEVGSATSATEVA